MQAKRNGVINIGSNSLNNQCNINLYSNGIQIGGGASGANSQINIGASNISSTYYNTVNICTSQVSNILNICFKC